MFLIQAPYPALKSTLLLPSPEMGNNRTLQSTVQTLRTMDGTLYTYIKRKRARKSHRWEFIVSADKGSEAKAFVHSYIGSVVKITDHENTVHIGYLTLNPFELTGEGRAGGWPGDEAYRFTIQLDEKV